MQNKHHRNEHRPKASVSDEGSVEYWFTDAVLPEGEGFGPHTHMVSMLVETKQYEERMVGFFDEASDVNRNTSSKEQTTWVLSHKMWQ